MSIDKLLGNITPEIYQRMQNAVMTGKWPNGVALSEEQKANCLQIVIAYDARHKDIEERVGYLPTKSSTNQENSTRQSDKRKDTQLIRFVED